MNPGPALWLLVNSCTALLASFDPLTFWSGLSVFGPPSMAKAGTVVVVLAGPASAVGRLKPYTDGV